MKIRGRYTLFPVLLCLLGLLVSCNKAGTPGPDSGMQDEYLTSDQQLVNIDFVSPTVGWAKESQGNLYKTCDGGGTWVKVAIPSNVKVTLFKLAGISSGWISTDTTLYYTHDGGRTWNLQLQHAYASEGMFVKSMDCFNQFNAWISTNQGYFYHTSDGGTAWAQTRTPTNSSILDMHFISATAGWAISAAGLYIYKTQDAGTTWTKVTSTWSPWQCLFPVNDSVCFALYNYSYITSSLIDSSMIYRTDDAGSSWTKQQKLDKISILNNKIVFKNKNQGWVMGMSMPSYANALFGTEDGGSSWKALTLTQNPIQDIDLADSCFVALDSKSQIITIQ